MRTPAPVTARRNLESSPNVRDSRHKIRPCGARKSRNGSPLARHRCGAIVQIARNEHGIRFSFITFATIRRKKPPFLTCPKCKSLMSAAFARASFRQVLEPDP